MCLVSVALFLLQFHIQRSVFLQHGETFKKICEGAWIDSKPIIELKHIEDAGDCALVCSSNHACTSFAYNFANSGKCHLYNENLDEMQIKFVANWSIFAMKSKTITIW